MEHPDVQTVSDQELGNVMTVMVGDFKQEKYGDIALEIRQVILDRAQDNHLTLVEAMGILEVVKIELYNEQVDAAWEDE